jgi:hypothetical protein
MNIYIPHIVYNQVEFDLNPSAVLLYQALMHPPAADAGFAGNYSYRAQIEKAHRFLK